MLVYFAGPLFTPYERRFIDENAARLRAAGIDVFVPHEQPLPRKPTAQAVFDKDGSGLFAANAVVALLDGPTVDDGTACEIGLFHGLQRSEPARRKGVLGLLTDSRSARATSRVLEGKGLNLYLLGCIERSGGEVCTTIEEIVAILRRWDAELEQSGA